MPADNGRPAASPDARPAWRHDRPIDRKLRRFGHWAYVGICAIAMLIVPADAQAPVWLDAIVLRIPAIDSLVQMHGSSTRMAAWVLASVLAYPLMHLCARSRLMPPPQPGTAPRSTLPVVVGVLLILVSCVLLLGMDVTTLHGFLFDTLRSVLGVSPVTAAVAAGLFAMTLSFSIAALLEMVRLRVTGQWP